jgi:hypothetical protein
VLSQGPNGPNTANTCAFAQSVAESMRNVVEKGAGIETCFIPQWRVVLGAIENGHDLKYTDAKFKSAVKTKYSVCKIPRPHCSL